MTLEELIVRLEKATGPDREFDAEIMRAIGWSEVLVNDCITGPENIWQRGGIRTISPGRFTDSIDAAKTIVPKGRWWNVQDIIGHANANVWGEDNIGDPPRENWACGPSPAIALCIAALKSRLPL